MFQITPDTTLKTLAEEIVVTGIPAHFQLTVKRSGVEVYIDGSTRLIRSGGKTLEEVLRLVSEKLLRP
jgi:hypothetical protein